MDQLKVKDRILENISLSVKKVSAARLVGTLKYCHNNFKYFHVVELANVRSSFVCQRGQLSSREGGGGTLPARSHVRALPLMI